MCFQYLKHILSTAVNLKWARERGLSKRQLNSEIGLVYFKRLLYYNSVVIEHSNMFARHSGAKTFMNCYPYEFRFL
jgi:hypothetical protein